MGVFGAGITGSTSPSGWTMGLTRNAGQGFAFVPSK
jgi:hypothetical protein